MKAETPGFPIRDTSLKARLRSVVRKTVRRIENRSSKFNFVPLPSDRLVLMYHRILPRDTVLPYPIEPGMIVTTQTFARHLKWLRESFKMVTLKTLFESSADLKPLCAVTFDDGWADTYRNAFPLLQSHQAPATVFVTTGMIGTERWFWPERVAWYWSRIGKAEGKSGSGMLREVLGHEPRSLTELVSLLKPMAPADREARIAQLAETHGFPGPNGRCLMNWDEVREMAQAGIEIGAHTENHAILTQVSSEVAEKELQRSRQRIESELGMGCQSLAYPNGDENDEIRKMAREAGFKWAVTTVPGWVSEEVDPLRIPRIGLHEDVTSNRAELAYRLKKYRKGSFSTR